MAVTAGHDELGDDETPDVIDARVNVTINVTDVNEAPTVTGEAAVSVEENLNRAVATYRGADPERDPLTWSVTGNDADSFTMTGRGALHFPLAAQLRGRHDHLPGDRHRHRRRHDAPVRLLQRNRHCDGR